MEETVLKISKDQVGRLQEKLKDPDQLGLAVHEVKRMLAIKTRLALEADVGC